MVVLINGSFGVGKSTVARLLCESLTGSAVYNPEPVGSVLMRLPRWIPLKGSGTDDFQDIDLWRRSVVAGTRMRRAFASGPVIVPMTFTRRAYFDEAITEIRRFELDFRVFWLKASVATVKQRLIGRGTRIEGPGSDWIARRIVECAEAERDGYFGEPVDTDDRSAHEVAAAIAQRIRQTVALNA